MKIISEYLNILQEQFDARIALTDINGDFENEWTNCYEVSCHRNFENKYEADICKTGCQIKSAMKAIARINSAKGKCGTAPEPNRCINTLENGIISYQKKTETYKQNQVKFQAKFNKFKTHGGG